MTPTDVSDRLHWSLASELVKVYALEITCTVLDKHTEIVNAGFKVSGKSIFNWWWVINENDWDLLFC